MAKSGSNWGFWMAFPKSWHREHVDCAEGTSLCQEANKCIWTSPILSRGVVNNSARWLPEACGWLSKAPHWGGNGQGTFKQIYELLYVSFITLSHDQTYIQFIIKPNCINVFFWQGSACSTYFTQEKWELEKLLSFKSAVIHCTCSLQVYVNVWPQL